MSDALTDIKRDARREEVMQKIVELEHKLLSGDLTTAEVEKLIEYWEQWARIPRGYWTCSDPRKAQQRIKLLRELLEAGETTLRLRRTKGEKEVQSSVTP